jgi:hypothetical protein
VRSSHPIGTPIRGLSPNTGVLATAAWLAQREVYPEDPKWFAEIALGADGARFVIEIYAEEWGIRFEHAGRESWIRVTDVAFVHGRDDHELLAHVPRLTTLGSLIKTLEAKHGIVFDRQTPTIRTTLAGADAAIADWVRGL